jgi:glycerophosphoryl diester phosphodiesterase
VELKMIKQRLSESPVPGMVLFEVIWKLFIWAGVYPLYRFILTLTLTVSGYQLAFNGFIVSFFLSVPGIVAAFILLILSSVFTYAELSVLILISFCGRQKQRPPLRFIYRETASGLGRLLHPGTLLFCVYVLGLLPVVGMGFSTSLFNDFDIPRFVTGELMKNSWGEYIWIAGELLVFSLFFASLFTVPAMILQKCGFIKAIGQGLKLTKVCGRKLFGLYAGFILMWSVFYGIPRYTFIYVFNTEIVSLGKIWAVFGFSSQCIVLSFLLLLFNMSGIMLLPLLMHFLVKRYTEAGGQILLSEPSAGEDKPLVVWERLRGIKLPKPVRLAAVLVVLVVLALFLLRVFNRVPGLHTPIVVGHRGSVYGVENTMPAVQGAIDAGADYAEIDIQLSADGVPMVIHDTNLKRLTGKDLNSYELTAAQLGELTVAQNGFTGKIPSLDEVVQYCNGKIGLVLEIKLSGYENDDTVRQVMAVLNQHNFVDECLFMSLDYEVIEDINTRYPEAKAGYCVFGNVGTLSPYILRSMKIDFIVTEESMVSSGNLYDFRGAWLPVYVWTVNDEANMRRYLEMGVLGIFSDYPDIGRRVLDEHMRTTKMAYFTESV